MVSWLESWDTADKPTRPAGAPANDRMARDGAAGGGSGGGGGGGDCGDC